MLKFYVKVSRTSLFLKYVVYLFYVWLDDRCRSKILCSKIPNPVYDFKIKVTNSKFLYCNFFIISVFSQCPQWILFICGRDDRALSKILRSAIPIPHGPKVKVTDFDFFVLNFYSVRFCKAFLIDLNHVWYEQI